MNNRREELYITPNPVSSCGPSNSRAPKFQFRRYRLVGLVVKASASRAEDSGFESRLSRDFSGVESYQ